MMSLRVVGTCLVLMAGMMLGAGEAVAQQPQPAPLQYGPDLTIEQARTAMAACEAKASENKWPVAICIVDTHGYLVMFQKLDHTQLASIEIATEKAKTAALFRRPTKALEDNFEKGGRNLRVLRLPGALPLEGGVPILVDGKVVGAIGVSGVKSEEDAEVAQAGADALLPKASN